MAYFILRSATIACSALLLTAVVVGKQPTQKACWAGQVVDVLVDANGPGGIHIANKTGSQYGPARDARNRECLALGDKIWIDAPSPAYVKVRIVGDTATLTKSERPQLVITGKPEPKGFAWLQSISRLGLLFSRTPQDVPIETFGDAHRESQGRPIPLPGIDAHKQWIPNGHRSLTILWQGANATIELTDARGRILATYWKADKNVIRFNPLSLDGLYKLTLDGSEIYEITTVARTNIPEPTNRAGQPSITDEDRVIRAMWLLTEGEPRWRLFALDELHELRKSSFFAERSWEAIAQGESLTGA